MPCPTVVHPPRFPSGPLGVRLAGPWLALCACLGTAQAQGIPRLFQAPWMGFDTGAWEEGFGPRSMAAGDLDLDGDVDVLVGQSYFGFPGISVLFNHGDGTYDRPVHYPLPFNDVVGQVALSDFDADGDLDAFATIPDGNGQGNRLLIWRNDGLGSFAGSPEPYITGQGPMGLVIADFVPDGHPDVVVANYGSNGQGTNIALFVHDGEVGPDAGYFPALWFDAGAGPLWVAAGDVDGDGLIDVAVARSELAAPHVSLLLNDGDGGFLPPSDLVSGPRGAPVVALADLDGDDDVDIVSGWHDNGGSISYGMVRVFDNDGTGSFPSFTDYQLDNFAEDPVHVDLSDVDGDGWLDILTANSNGRSQEGWRVLFNQAGTGFGELGVYPCSQNTEWILGFDADGDEDRDVLTLSRFSSALTVHDNPGNGVFWKPTPHRVAWFVTGMDAADIDGDDDLDLVAASGSVEIFANQGAGTFAPAEEYPTTVGASDVKLRDLDGDGHLDILTNRAPGGGFSVGWGNGDGTFEADEPFSLDSCGGNNVDAFDLDADGDLDVVKAGCAGGGQNYLFVARNDGGRAFTAQPHVPTLVFTKGIAAAHVDGDAHLDLVSIEGGFGLATYPGDGALGFGAGIISSEPPYLFGLNDFDMDGLTDAAVLIPASAFGTDRVGIALGRGDGTFTDPALVNASSVLESLRVGIDLDIADADCDGRADVFVTSYASNDIGVFISNGDGTLQPQVRYGANITPSQSLIADVTGDGLEDIVTSSQEVGPPAVGQSIIVLPGTCGGDVAPNPCPVAPPEVDPGSLRVIKTGPAAEDVKVSFFAGDLSDPDQSVNVFRGTIASLDVAGPYDHGPVTDGCLLQGSPFVDPLAAALGGDDWYYLAARQCGTGADAVEGPYGVGFDGIAFPPRPTSIEASGEFCP